MKFVNLSFIFQFAMIDFCYIVSTTAADTNCYVQLSYEIIQEMDDCAGAI